MKTKPISTAAILLMAALLSACNTGDLPPDSSLSPTPQDTIQNTKEEKEPNMNTSDYFMNNAPKPCPSALVSDEMYARATNFAAPELSRLVNVMKRAATGEDITVAAIGGSITQGSITSSQDKAYASIMKKWWEDTFPQSNITFVNAGIGGTDSYLGVHRADSQLLAYRPDFVIVEFSVNDSTTPFYKTSYDNLVRRILKQDNMPAVLLLFMTQEDGTSAIDNDSIIGFNYRLPMLSYRGAVLDEIRKGSFTWKDISPDNIHPNDKGHALCGEIIWRYLNSVYSSIGTESFEAPTLFNQAAVTKEKYQQATILDASGIKPLSENNGFTEGCTEWSVFKNGWSTDNGGSISFTVTAANIGLLYYQTTSPGYGNAEVFVDGEKMATLTGYDKDTWGNHGVAEQVFEGKEKTEHTLTVKTTDENSAFDIFGILIS